MASHCLSQKKQLSAKNTNKFKGYMPGMNTPLRPFSAVIFCHPNLNFSLGQGIRFSVARLVFQ